MVLRGTQRCTKYAKEAAIALAMTSKSQFMNIHSLLCQQPIAFCAGAFRLNRYFQWRNALKQISFDFFFLYIF